MQRQSRGLWLPGRREGWGRAVTGKERVGWWEALKLTAVRVAQLCDHMERRWTSLLRWVRCMQRELYLSKAVFKKNQHPRSLECS